ncbi:MAG: DUF2723 domain-containing protein [Candidatus Zixiibacteriota bacterium]
MAEQSSERTDTRTTTGGVWARLFPDPVLGVLGLGSFAFVLVTYLMTVSPTVSFWDCGEFIACSHILGIPHPPGTPSYILLGRIFAMLPTAADPSLRVNLLSSISTALAAGFAFFVLARLITSWYSDRYPNPQLTLPQRLSVYAGSICGSLMLAFSSTNWNNAVEAEVYGLAMFLMVLLVWLSLIWVQKREEPDADRLLVLIAYLAMFSVGVHMTVMLAVVPIFLMMVMLSPRLRRDPRFWITGLALFLVTVGIVKFLYASVGWLILTTIIGVSGKVTHRWRFYAVVTLLGLIGFSTHAYIPIRSMHDPAIDQNDPETWTSFIDFLERRQYGQTSMFERALERRGEWSNQFGQHRRMGFWGFFDRQYGFNDQLFFPIFAVGLLGVGYLIWRRRALGVMLLLLLILTSVGLVWYMNFADGTKYDPVKQDAYLEVRDRDYFFTAAFIFFGMSIGLGGAVLIRWLSGGAVPWALVGSVVIAALPFRTWAANYDTCDRSKNYIAYDYAYNILSSCDPNAILFTNGDNDTFPVWCLQQVYGVRADVRNANLSLLNTHWYIRQLRDQLNVPMNLTDNQISRLTHYRTQDNEVVRIQDQMVDEILTANNWQDTINFSVTVSASSRRYRGRPLDNHLMLIGFVQRLVREEGRNMVDLDLLRYRIDSVFQFRGLNDPDVYKDENTQRLVGNYFSTFLVAADEYRKRGNLEKAEEYAMKGIRTLPTETDGLLYLTQLWSEHKRPDKLDTLLTLAASLPTDRNRVETSIAMAFRTIGDSARAMEVAENVYRRDPDYEFAYRTLVQLYFDAGRFDTLTAMMSRWLEQHPDDRESRSILTQVETVVQRLSEEPAPSDTTAAETSMTPGGVP